MTSGRPQRPRKPTDGSPPDPDAWLNDHGDLLYAIAFRAVGRRELAEDLVQETLLAALRSFDRFQRDSAVATWLIGILKHRIADLFRRAAALPDDADDPSPFRDDGQWCEPVAPSIDPGRRIQNEEFHAALERCMALLPDSLALPFRLREIEGLELPEIARHLDLAPGALRVRLHRARLRLRTCLERQMWDPRTSNS